MRVWLWAWPLQPSAPACVQGHPTALVAPPAAQVSPPLPSPPLDEAVASRAAASRAPPSPGVKSVIPSTALHAADAPKKPALTKRGATRLVLISLELAVHGEAARTHLEAHARGVAPRCGEVERQPAGNEDAPGDEPDRRDRRVGHRVAPVAHRLG